MPRIAVVYQGVFQYDALNAFAAGCPHRANSGLPET